MLEPRQLNETDREILAFMTDEGGRVTPAWIADETDNSRPYVSQRLKRMKEHGHVDQPYRGLWELVDDPREGVEGMRCHNCERTHADWTKDGEHTVDDGHHAGIIERYRCGRCGSVTEGGRR